MIQEPETTKPTETPNPISVRQVQERDLEGCYYVENHCYGQEGASRERIAKRIAIYPTGFLVAETGNRIVGIVNGTSTNVADISDEKLKDMVDFDREGKNIVIFSIAVLPEYQGKGVARVMLDKFLDNCRLSNKEKVLLICRENHIPMYERFGFELVGESKSEHGGVNWFEMILNLNKPLPKN